MHACKWLCIVFIFLENLVEFGYCSAVIRGFVWRIEASFCFAVACVVFLTTRGTAARIVSFFLALMRAAVRQKDLQ